ncbi:MAG: immunoglobulin domain-containing protein, partial [Bacteroidota bacterium]
MNQTGITSTSYGVSGLAYGTAHYWRVDATNSAGTSHWSTVWSFTTSAGPPLSSIVSDDFSASTLSTSLWTFVNPLGDATVTLTGTGTPDARLSVGVPGGSSHDAWTGGNFAPRIMQPANNVDFEVEVKFESTMSTQYQLEGVIVQQDANNYLRFDFVKDASRTRAFAASFVGGTPTVRSDVTITGGNPLYPRVKRQGNQWTQLYSYNGTNWTTATSFSHTLTVGSVGPFIGNAGSPAPAFTGLIDYFFNTTSPIVQEDPSTPVAPAITTQPTNLSVTVGQAATFSVAASGTPPLTYQWQKNNVDVAGATSASYTIPPTAMADSGATFCCIVTNSVGSATSNSATLVVTSGPPSSTIFSDDFSAASLNTSLWVFINPGTPSTLGLVG